MKRSRTCQCLVELDSPKRTRSTPDLAALRRKHNLERERTLDDSMMTASAAGLDSPLHILWRAPSPVAATAAATAAAATAETSNSASVPVASSEAFVVDSVVRRGSLNEITILEHEQFIGEERAAGQAGAVGRRASAGLFFGGTSPGGLLDDDSGDSSDYFCGVASSDEADEDSRCETGTTTTTTTAADPVGGGSGSGLDAPCVITPNMSDAESAGHVSDASSHAAAKELAGRDNDDAKVHADGAVSSPPPAPPSSWGKPGHSGFSASFPPTRFNGGSSWRQQQQRPSSCSNMVTVRVMSSLGVSGDLGGVPSPPFSDEGREEQKDRRTTTTQTTRQTVSPPWPFLVSASAWLGTPASAPAAFYGDSLAVAAAAATGGVYVVPESHTGGRQQYRGSDGGRSIFSAGEEVKILGGFNRLRLVDDPTKPPVVGMGSLDPVWSCRSRGSPLAGVGMEGEADTALEVNVTD